MGHIGVANGSPVPAEWELSCRISLLFLVVLIASILDFGPHLLPIVRNTWAGRAILRGWCLCFMPAGEIMVITEAAEAVSISSTVTIGPQLSEKRQGHFTISSR